MVRSWEGAVWALVIAIAIAVVVGAVVAQGAGAMARVRSGAGESQQGPRASGAGPRLNEILAGPARDWDGDGVYDAKGDEWIEIQNVGAAAILLDDLRLTDADRTIRYALSGTLAPGDVRLVTGSEAVAWQRLSGLSTSGLSLNNSGDTVYLLRVAGADTSIVDTHGYGSIEGGSDRSVGHPGTGSEDWILFDALNPYTGSGTPSGTGCAPTPGGVNGCTTDVRRTTWGAIKRLYR